LRNLTIGGYYIIDDKIYDCYGQPKKNIQKGDMVSEKPDEYLWKVLNNEGLGADYIIKQQN